MIGLARRLFLAAMMASVVALGLPPPQASALSGSEFQAGRIIDDSKFAAQTMSVAEIQAFLNSKVPTCDTNHARSSDPDDPGPPYTCLKSYTDSTIGWAAESGLCNAISGRTGNAAEIIYWVGQACGINPQVLIVLLQKEQSLVTDTWPWPYQYRFATGFCVYDTGPPPPSCEGTEGFFGQLYYAARQFKKYARTPSSYGYRAGVNNNILWHPDAARCGDSIVYIENKATAGLYNYTPYRPNQAALNNLYGTGDSCSSYGNRNFWRLYNDWFGSTLGPPDYSCKFSTNVAGAGPGARVIPNKFTAGNNDLLTLSLLNETGSACIEMHTWNSNQQGWVTNVATNLPAIHPAYAEITSGNLYGDAKSEIIYLPARSTGSGRIEVHTWDSTYQRWITNIATNHLLIANPEDYDIIAGDTNGDGRDELVLVKYRNTGSGRIEIHTWAPGLQSWISNVATNHPVVGPGDGRIIAANLYGDARDELVFIKYRNTGSGRIEVHTWAPGLQAWISNVATNHPVVDPADIEVTAANMYGGGIDELVLIKYRNSGSGRIEIHTWAPGQQSWISNIATNHSSL